MSKFKTKTVSPGPDDIGRRLDRVMRKHLPGKSLSYIYKMLRKKDILLNGKKADPASRIQTDDEITLPDFGGGGEQQNAGTGWQVEPLIILENEHVLALNKPPGMRAHGKDSLNDMVQDYVSLRPSLSFRCGPVHRLDQNTSGLILFAKTLRASHILSSLFRSGGIEKYYIALVDGRLEEGVRWVNELVRDRNRRVTEEAAAGLPAVTLAEPVWQEKTLTLVLCNILTGRTHQIRAQAALNGHPLCGDIKYGGSGILPRFFLHSAALVLKHPHAFLGFRSLRAPLPEDKESVLETLLGPAALKKAAGILRERITGK